MSRYAQDREIRFRGGIRILLAGVVVATTWTIGWLAMFAASAPWFGPRTVSLRQVVLWFLVGLLTCAAGVVVIGLVRGARWRWAASGGWVGSLVLTAVAIGLPSTRDWRGGFAFGLAGIGIAAVYALTLLKFDPPAT